MPIIGRILIVENSLAYTGAYKSIKSIIDSLSKEFNFYWILPKGSKIITNDLENLNYLNFIEIGKNWKILIYLPFLFWNSIKMLRIIRKNEIKILHINDLYNLTGILVKLLYPKIKLIYHIRLLSNSYLGMLYKWFVYLIIRYADQVICVSEIVSRQLPDSRTKIIIYDSLPGKEKYPPKNEIKKTEVIKILYIGNLIKGKGQDLALKAFSKAIKIKEDLTLTFVGGNMNKQKNNNYYKYLNSLAIKLNVDKYINFLHFNSDIEELIKKYDIVLNLSESESFSMVCLEALYYGTPLIASNSGGPKELFENGKSGILVPNKDPDAAAEAIANLAKNDELRYLLSIEGKKFVKQKFDMKASSLRLRNVYNRLLKEK